MALLRIVPLLLFTGSWAFPQTAPVTLKVAVVQFRSTFDVADNRRRR